MMGTTYQAQVEVEAILTAGSSLWQSISRWELQKDYYFAAAWAAVSDEGWPIDYAPEGKYASDVEQKRHGSGSLLHHVYYQREWPWFLELKAHVQSLIARGYNVRIITWGE